MKKFILIIIACVLSLFNIINQLQAQTTKTTKADGRWSDPNVWTGGAIPDAANKASINNHIIIDMDVNILNLTINASSSLTFDTINPIIFTVADEVNINGEFNVDSNKVNPLIHTVKVGSNLYGPGSIDFYEEEGDAVEIVFIGNSDSELKDLVDLTGSGENGKFGGLKIEKNIVAAKVFLRKPVTINSGNLTITKGILDVGSFSINAGDNLNSLILDSLGSLLIASTDTFSCAFFEDYIIHNSSTIQYYMDTNYEITKGWTGFNGNIGNLTISGDGNKYFGDGIVHRIINGSFNIEKGGTFNLDNDSVEIKGLFSINGILETSTDHSVLICNGNVIISDSASWTAYKNNIFEFRNGLTVNKDANFISGDGQYIFTSNNQELIINDTIHNTEINTINVLNSEYLTCNTLNGNGALINKNKLDFTGEKINCNLILDSIGNRVIYSNKNPQITSAAYEIIEIKADGTSELDGEILVKNSLEKNTNGIISLNDYNLVIDTAASFIFDNPSTEKMIVTNGTGSLVIKSNTSDRFMTIFPVGTTVNENYFSPVEITNNINHPGGEKFIAVKAKSGYHAGMEDTVGLSKFWSIQTNFIEEDSISANLKFIYDSLEVTGNENNYEVRFWTGNKPWMEPNVWDLDPVTHEFNVQNLNSLSFDWTAGDSTAITSKVDDLTSSLVSGLYYNPQTLTLSTTTPDVNIYYTTDGTDPDIYSTLYTTMLEIDTSVTIKSIGIKKGWQNSNINTCIITFQVDSVEFSLTPDDFNNSQIIELSTLTAGAQIYYSTDGSIPDESDNLYNSAIILDSSQTLKAIAYKDNYIPSIITSEDYYFYVDTVIYNKLSGTYKSIQNIELSTVTENATIRYTLDGSTPDLTSYLYENPILIETDITIKVIAYKTGYTSSIISEESYIILYDTVDAPIFSKNEGEYTSAITIELSTDTSDTEIYYTYGNEIPDNINGELYTTALSIENTTTLNAIAYKNGLKPSKVVTKTYTINIPLNIDENQNLSMEVYPNPVLDYFKISNTEKIQKVCIFNINGILVKEFTDGFNELNITDLQIGIYFLKIIDKTGNSITKKIIKK